MAENEIIDEDGTSIITDFKNGVTVKVLIEPSEEYLNKMTPEPEEPEEVNLLELKRRVEALEKG